MYKNKANGRNNLCGLQVAKLRKVQQPPWSQRMLADQLQLVGLDLDKNAVQRIESGQRFVTDIELQAMARLFSVSTDALLEDPRLESESSRDPDPR